MADYFSIKEVLATTENMAIIRDNSGNDDGTDTLTGVSWFSYNSVTAESIYVNGNSWIGIGSNTERSKSAGVMQRYGRSDVRKERSITTITFCASAGRAIPTTARPQKT